MMIWLSCVTTFPGQADADELDNARVLFWSGQFAECREAAERAILADDALEDWYELLIRCHLGTGQYEAALEALDEGLTTQPSSIRLRWLGNRVCLLNGQTQRAAELLLDLEDKIRYRSWRYRDAPNRVVQARFALRMRADAKQVLDELLIPATSARTNDIRAWQAIAELAQANHDYAMAAENWRKLVELAPANPAGFLGLARAFRPSDPAAASEALQQALQIDPEYVPALLYLIDDRINSEQYADAETLIQRVLAVNPRNTDAWCYRAVLAHLDNNPDRESECRREAFGQWTSNSRIDYLIGKKLSQKYRFAEGARYQRRALSYDPDHLQAKIQLANDLLRLGGDEEGWNLASEVYRDDGYNVVAYNLVTLGREMADFCVLNSDGFIVRMHPDEADIYGQRVLQLLREGKRRLADKYQMTVSEPVFVEIFPDQKDFAIRTFGLPGGRGFLGVCFGRVITMNSPASKTGAGHVNWESVLWHEFCHVVTLQKTQNKMPRWLSEGISVYEELEADATWGQVMTPRYREMILDGEMPPVSQLSAAFLQPASPEHLQFAYFESSLVVRYLVEQHGIETLLQVLDDLAIGMPVNEVLGRRTGGIELLDKEFAEYARGLADALAPGMDWTRPDAATLASRAQCQAWNAAHPDNWYGLRAEAALLIREGQWAAARPLLERVASLFPDHRAADSAWTMLAAVARGQGDTDREIEMLEKSAALSASDMQVLTRLLELYAERQDWEKLRATAEKVLAVDPLGPLAHEQLARAAEAIGDYSSALAPLATLTGMDPVDPADIHFRYAQALNQTGAPDMARRQLLKCLEQAPRFQAAHRLLLELTPADVPPETAEPDTSTDAGNSGQ